MSTTPNSTENVCTAICNERSLQVYSRQVSAADMEQADSSSSVESMVEYDPLYYLMEAQRLTQKPDHWNEDILCPLPCWTETLSDQSTTQLPLHYSEDALVAGQSQNQVSPIDGSVQGHLPQIPPAQPKVVFPKTTGHCRLEKGKGNTTTPTTCPIYNVNTYNGTPQVWSRSVSFPPPSSVLSPRYQYQTSRNFSAGTVKHTSTAKMLREDAGKNISFSNQERVQTDGSSNDGGDAASNCFNENEIAKPLSAYNFFFLEERERLIVENGDGNGAKVWHRIRNKSYECRMKKLLAQRLSVKDKNKPRRKHRKVNGKIDFSTLSKLISQRWRHLPLAEKNFYQKVSDADLQRYQMQLKIVANAKIWSSTPAVTHS